MDFDLAAQVTDLVEEMTGQSAAQAQRDPKVPAGTVLAEVETDGGTVREVKNRSLVRMGKTPLPERFEAWDIYGRPSQLPTAQMTYMLQKPNTERPERRAFHLHRPPVTRQTCTQCPPAPAKYEGSCVWCFERTGGTVVKAFETEDAQFAHYRAFHGEQYETMERRLDRELQREAIAIQREQVAAMTALAQAALGGQIPTTDPIVQQALAAADLEDEGVTPVASPVPFVCETCGQKFAIKVALVGHQRTHASKE